VTWVDLKHTTMPKGFCTVADTTSVVSSNTMFLLFQTKHTQSLIGGLLCDVVVLHELIKAAKCSCNVAIGV
jgi:hypothetical protein